MVTKQRKDSHDSRGKISRREFFALGIAAGAAVLVTRSDGAEISIVETDVSVKTSDGVCDAVFFYPGKGKHPGVLVWPDSGALRPAFREIGKRLAAEGYGVLIPNHLYRTAKAPVFPEGFNPVRNPEDAAFYRRITAPFFAAGAVERDAAAYVAFLDAQKQVDKNRKLGVQGYCLGGAYVIKTAALFPDRVGAGASFHGGFLVTSKPDSPHLLAPKIKARLYFAVASDDDKREPEAKDKLKEALAAANVRAEVELYPDALHGWCVPDNKNVYKNKVDADRAWAKLIALYKSAL